MPLLCFLLDLRNVSHSLFQDLKQSLLQLANLYAVTAGRQERYGLTDEALMLPDRIGLCYIQRSESSTSSAELKVAYRPGGNFTLRDFHHAVNSLPMNSLAVTDEFTTIEADNKAELSIRRILSDDFLFKWGSKDILKKIVVIASPLFTNTELLEESLMDAASRSVTVEFVVIVQDDDLFSEYLEKQRRFMYNVNQLHQCVIIKDGNDTWTMSGLVKRWLQELINEVEALKAVIIFKHAIWESSNQISCNLVASTNPIIDGFESCQACRCHGYPVSSTFSKKKKNTCPVTFLELGDYDLIDDAVRVGGETSLCIPSFERISKLQRTAGPISLTVVERTSMASLNEGVIMGASYIVTPERHGKVTGEHADDICDLNAHIFNGLCESLFDLDQALVCSSSCNLEKMACGSFICFYILQPSHYGLMLLKRLAGSEEVLPMPSQLKETVVSNELKNCIQASLSKVEVRDYNPLEHERGLHRKLNWFVKESLQCGSITAKVEASSEPADLLLHQPTSPQNSSLILLPEEENEGFPTPKKDEKMPSSETGDWEHLIIDDKNHSFSPSHISQSKPQSSTKSQSRTLDERTCKILERLEVPKQQRQKASSPNISVNSVGEQMKKPLLPFDPSSSQPFRPSFQRSKRKLA